MMQCLFVYTFCPDFLPSFLNLTFDSCHRKVRKKINTKREREKKKLDSFLESLMILFLRFNHANVHVSTILGVRYEANHSLCGEEEFWKSRVESWCHQSLLFDAFENRKERERREREGEKKERLKRDEEKKKRLRRGKESEKDEVVLCWKIDSLETGYFHEIRGMKKVSCIENGIRERVERERERE